MHRRCQSASPNGERLCPIWLPNFKLCVRRLFLTPFFLGRLFFCAETSDVSQRPSPMDPSHGRLSDNNHRPLGILRVERFSLQVIREPGCSAFRASAGSCPIACASVPSEAAGINRRVEGDVFRVRNDWVMEDGAPRGTTKGVKPGKLRRSLSLYEISS